MKIVADPNGAFQFAVPSGWKVMQQQGGVGAMDQQNGFSVACMAVPKQFQTLQQFVQAMCQGFQKQVQGWQAAGQQAIQVGNVQGIHVRASGSPQGEVMGADYIFVLTQRSQILLMYQYRQAQAQPAQAVFTQIAGTFQVR